MNENEINKKEMKTKKEATKQNFKVIIKLKTLEKATGKQVEELIMSLIKNNFKSGRIKAI